MPFSGGKLIFWQKGHQSLGPGADLLWNDSCLYFGLQPQCICDHIQSNEINEKL